MCSSDLPAEFGRLYRVSITRNPLNPLSSILYVISRNSSGRLSQSPDALKDNIATYINEYRLVGDAIDILDARVINYRVIVSVVTGIGVNKQDVASKIRREISKVAQLDRYQIGTPLIEADFINAIINVNGVLALEELEFENLSNTILDREYSKSRINMEIIKQKGMYFANFGDIFELRYPDFDIEVSVQ